MKFKLFTCSIITAMMTFAAGKAAALPLLLTSFSGTNWSTVYATTPPIDSAFTASTNKIVIAKIGLPQLMKIVSNQVFLNTGTVIPTNSQIGFDPLTGTTFLKTNKTGYVTNLADIVSVSIPNIATTFHGTSRTGNAGFENDIITFKFRVVGTSPDGLLNDINLFGRGHIGFNVNTNNHAVMRITARGAGFGAYKVASENASQQDGVFEGNLIFAGKGVPDWDGPYSIKVKEQAATPPAAE